MLLDEIEKASDALWNLLLGILDKGVLTLGDNRGVDFATAMIFMTSNLGAHEIRALITPRFGLDLSGQAATVDGKSNEKLDRCSIADAWRKFTPEFINRINNIVTFKPLGSDQLNQILDIELKVVWQRIFNASRQPPFVFELTTATGIGRRTE